MAWQPAGNSNPQAIDNPEALRLDRRSARHHLSSRFGIHRCLGSRLAEMQLRVRWEEIMKRFPAIELDGMPERVSSCMFHGFSSMPVRIPH